GSRSLPADRTPTRSFAQTREERMPFSFRTLVLIAAISAALTAPSAATAATGALQHEDECATLAIAPSDDGSSSQLNLGFTVRFGWQDFTSVYINNNGNLTFGNPLPNFSPFVPSYLGHRMIAPFF